MAAGEPRVRIARELALDRHVLTLYVAGFAKPLAERGHIAR